MESLDVSVVIVSMNNLTMLFPCLESIINYTKKASYEIIVVAYLFSNENLMLLKEKYPKVKIIESNEIRGFSENNNLALREAKGNFSLILNDDTYFDTPLIDDLVDSFSLKPEADFFSPVIYDKYGIACGRPPESFISFVLMNLFKIKYVKKEHRRYINQKGIFQTYNIAGCCFMVKTNVLKELGYFNEQYFFCPEDIELSTIANKIGKRCYVNTSVKIQHRQGSTFSLTSLATFPAMYKGFSIFYSKVFKLPKSVIDAILIIGLLKNWIYWSITKRNINKKRIINSIVSLLTKKTPKEIFVHYYKTIKSD